MENGPRGTRESKLAELFSPWSVRFILAGNRLSMAVREGLLPDRYVGAQPIGRGGMGEIYRATDTALGRAVAIKLLADRYAQDENVRARFTREALAAARLSGNPHIVTIYDVGEHNDRPYIVMEYLGGGSLEQVLRDGPVAPRQAFGWLEQAANALDAAHREGVIHRDVKPANLLLDRRDHVHVADFGIASAAGLASLTQTGTVLGTASYLSPEQAQGERATPQSDLYSLAVVAFELLTGRRPFEGDSVAAEAAAHVTSEVPSVCDVNPDAPCELDPVFEKALAKDPRDRFTSGAELVAALRASLDQAAGVTRIVPRAAPVRRRRSPLVPALVLLGLALVGATVAFALTRNGGAPRASSPPRTVRVTVNGPGRTVISTVVTTQQAPTTSATTTSSPGSAGGNPVAENDQAWRLMQRGDFPDALPLLQDAVQQLQGQDDTLAGYANFNLGYTLVRLGQCSQAIPYLETARSIEPQRHEVHDALRQAQHCAGDNG
jgi:serine/threonine-protein kinase